MAQHNIFGDPPMAYGDQFNSRESVPMDIGGLDGTSMIRGGPIRGSHRNRGMHQMSNQVGHQNRFHPYGQQQFSTLEPRQVNTMEDSSPSRDIFGKVKQVVGNIFSSFSPFDMFRRNEQQQKDGMRNQQSGIGNQHGNRQGGMVNGMSNGSTQHGFHPVHSQSMGHQQGQGGGFHSHSQGMYQHHGNNRGMQGMQQQGFPGPHVRGTFGAGMDPRMEPKMVMDLGNNIYGDDVLPMRHNIERYPGSRAESRAESRGGSPERLNGDRKELHYGIKERKRGGVPSIFAPRSGSAERRLPLRKPSRDNKHANILRVNPTSQSSRGNPIQDSSQSSNGFNNTNGLSKIDQAAERLKRKSVERRKESTERRKELESVDTVGVDIGTNRDTRRDQNKTRRGELDVAFSSAEALKSFLDSVEKETLLPSDNEDDFEVRKDFFVALITRICEDHCKSKTQAYEILKKYKNRELELYVQLCKNWGVQSSYYLEVEAGLVKEASFGNENENSTQLREANIASLPNLSGKLPVNTNLLSKNTNIGSYADHISPRRAVETEPTASILGQQQESKLTTSILGQQQESKPTTSIFGQEQESKPTTSIFGQQQESKPTTSILGQSKTNNSGAQSKSPDTTIDDDLFVGDLSADNFRAKEPETISKPTSPQVKSSVKSDTAPTSSIFGITNNTNPNSTGTSIFSDQNKTTSIFGNTSTVFGQAGAKPASSQGSNPTPSIFGQSSTPADNNIFGMPRKKDDVPKSVATVSPKKVESPASLKKTPPASPLKKTPPASPTPKVEKKTDDSDKKTADGDGADSDDEGKSAMYKIVKTSLKVVYAKKNPKKYNTIKAAMEKYETMSNGQKPEANLVILYKKVCKAYDLPSTDKKGQMIWYGIVGLDDNDNEFADNAGNEEETQPSSTGLGGGASTGVGLSGGASQSGSIFGTQSGGITGGIFGNSSAPTASGGGATGIFGNSSTGATGVSNIFGNSSGTPSIFGTPAGGNSGKAASAFSSIFGNPATGTTSTAPGNTTATTTSISEKPAEKPTESKSELERSVSADKDKDKDGKDGKAPPMKKRKSILDAKGKNASIFNEGTTLFNSEPVNPLSGISDGASIFGTSKKAQAKPSIFDPNSNVLSGGAIFGGAPSGGAVFGSGPSSGGPTRKITEGSNQDDDCSSVAGSVMSGSSWGSGSSASESKSKSKTKAAAANAMNAAATVKKVASMKRRSLKEVQKASDEKKGSEAKSDAKKKASDEKMDSSSSASSGTPRDDERNTTSTNIFGIQSGTTGTNIFGTGPSGETGSDIFGTSKTAGAGAPSTNIASTNIFGTGVASTGTSIFGGATSASNSGTSVSIFGSSNNNTPATSSIFGAAGAKPAGTSPSNTAGTGTSIFSTGSNKVEAPSATIGATPTTTSSDGSIFGTKLPTETAGSIFGAKAGSIFGAKAGAPPPTSTVPAGSIFGTAFQKDGTNTNGTNTNGTNTITDLFGGGFKTVSQNDNGFSKGSVFGSGKTAFGGKTIDERFDKDMNMKEPSAIESKVLGGFAAKAGEGANTTSIFAATQAQMPTQSQMPKFGTAPGSQMPASTSQMPSRKRRQQDIEEEKAPLNRRGQGNRGREERIFEAPAEEKPSSNPFANLGR